MKSIIALLLFTITAALAADGLTSFENNDHVDEYEYEVPSFTGNFGPNGESMTLNGTVEQVVAQVAEINPAFDWNLPAPRHRRDGDDDDGILRVEDFSRYNCAIGDRWVAQRFIEGIDYLKRMPGHVSLYHGKRPRRVSCSWNAGIFLGFVPWTKETPDVDVTWNYVGQMAQIVYNRCFKPAKQPFREDALHGQVWGESGAHIALRMSTC